ncbi:LRRC16 [Acanthosepion pharaonis]|uniref:LRRC16 n=1 Tax=Acanthosepion pharaonis TaxID=158019 RepID=A0A812E9Z3_ACAPH|nr:LRRC16 [Sepia pharaonis]
MPTPVFDATAAIKYQPEKVEATLQKIECLLQRNHSPRKFSSDQGYRLQQGFLISSTQQMVDRLVVQMQDTMNALTIDSSSSSSSANIEHASRYIDDANNCQQLLPQLQKIAIKSQEVGNPVEQKLNSMVEELHEVLNSHVENTVSDMLECAKVQCSAVLSNESFLSDLEADVAEKRKLPKDIISQVLGDVSTDIFNRLSDLNLVIAAHLSDRILEGVIESLSKSHKQLTNELNVKKRYRFSGSFDTDKNEKADLEIPSEKLSEKAALEDHEKESSTLRCSPGYSPKLNTKKKSLYGRKLRPQSVIDHDAVQQALKNHSDKTLRSHGEDEEEAEDSGVGSSGGGVIRHTITESPEMMNRSTVSSGSDISLSSVLSQAGSSPRHPDLGPNRMTKSASKTLTDA